MYKWSAAHITFHRDLLKRSREMSWRELLAECLPACTLEDPVSPADIAAAEKKLGHPLPPEIRSFYQEYGSLQAESPRLIVFPLAQAVEENLALRDFTHAERYMPFNGVFIFGSAGGEERYFYPRYGNGKYGDSLFFWAPETDSRTWQADSLRSVLIHTRTDALEID